MKVTNILKDNFNNTRTIETLTSRSFLGIKLKPIKRKFFANERRVADYWRWVELPDKILVNDELSFQLDTWLRIDI